jgi:hypothetical protein
LSLWDQLRLLVLSSLEDQLRLWDQLSLWGQLRQLVLSSLEDLLRLWDLSRLLVR